MLNSRTCPALAGHFLEKQDSVMSCISAIAQKKSRKFRKCRTLTTYALMSIWDPTLFLYLNYYYYYYSPPLKGFTSWLLSRSMTVVATRDLLRKESQGPERAHRPRRNIPLKTPDYKLHLFYTIVERSPLSGWREREQATPTSIISLSQVMYLAQEKWRTLGKTVPSSPLHSECQASLLW